MSRSHGWRRDHRRVDESGPKKSIVLAPQHALKGGLLVPHRGLCGADRDRRGKRPSFGEVAANLQRGKYMGQRSRGLS